MLDRIAYRMPNPQRFFDQADYHKPNQLLIVGLVAGALTMTASWFAHVPVFFVPVVGILMFLAPWGWLWNRRRVRLKKFAAQLPDALELGARAPRAWASLAAGEAGVGGGKAEASSLQIGRAGGG